MSWGIDAILATFAHGLGFLFSYSPICTVCRCLGRGCGCWPSAAAARVLSSRRNENGHRERCRHLIQSCSMPGGMLLIRKNWQVAANQTC